MPLTVAVPGAHMPWGLSACCAVGVVVKVNVNVLEHSLRDGTRVRQVTGAKSIYIRGNAVTAM